MYIMLYNYILSYLLEFPVAIHFLNDWFPSTGLSQKIYYNAVYLCSVPQFPDMKQPSSSPLPHGSSTANGKSLLYICFIYRVAQKKWNGILPTICRCNNWYQCTRVTSEKNYTKISNFGAYMSLDYLYWLLVTKT